MIRLSRGVRCGRGHDDWYRGVYRRNGRDKVRYWCVQCKLLNNAGKHVPLVRKPANETASSILCDYVLRALSTRELRSISEVHSLVLDDYGSVTRRSVRRALNTLYHTFRAEWTPYMGWRKHG